jgi:N-methylhydantoinase B
MKIDPITTEVIASRLGEIASAMEYALYHSGYSPILRESKDGTAGLTDASGRAVILSGGLQYHLLSYEQAVQEVRRRYPASVMRPGDSFVVNDPYLAGNAHAPDMAAVTPAFHSDGTLIGFGVSIAHKADIGGIVAGSSGAAAREIFHDGLLLPAVRFQTAAGIEEAVEAIIRNNSRVPDMVLGDIRAQVGCTRLGAERLADLCSEFSADVVKSSMDGLITVTSQRLRDDLVSWPDASGEAEGFLDHDGADKSKRVRIHVRAEKRGDKITLDLSGCDPQTVGPVNLISTTARAVSLLALVATVDPTIRVNAGLMDAVDFIIPSGRVVSPIRPATVNHYFPTAHLVYSCVLAALGRVNPACAVAPSGLGSGGVSIGYACSRAGKPAVLYELMVTSLGGTTARDGAAIVHSMSHFTPSTPIEILETEYPVRIRRFDIRRDSAGAGRFRGGIGYIREYEVLEDCVMTVRSSNHSNPAWGVHGGQSPMPSRVTLNPGTPDQALLDPIVTRQLRRGDVLRFEQSGGGGFGIPQERADASVLADVLNGYVSPEAAQRLYGRTVAGATIVPRTSAGASS